MLSSAGVPVEVCRVLADTPVASKKALDALKKRKAMEARTESGELSKMKREAEGEWSGDEQAEDTEGEEDEWRYESGEEGKAEGKWEKGGSGVGRKRVKRE